MTIRSIVPLIAALAVPLPAGAQPQPPASGGSTAFCLYEVPSESPDRKRWVNLGIIQYVETGRSEVRIVFGGGNFGSGHEARIPVANAEEAQAVLERMRKAAAACR